MSRRNDIRADLLTALQTIDGTGSFETAPRQIISYEKSPAASLLPAVQITNWTEEREAFGFTGASAVLSFNVRCLSGKELETSRITELEQMIADVERALATDVTLGRATWGVQAGIVSVDITPGAEGQEWGYADVTVATPYRFDRGTP